MRRWAYPESRAELKGEVSAQLNGVGDGRPESDLLIIAHIDGGLAGAIKLISEGET